MTIRTIRAKQTPPAPSTGAILSLAKPKPTAMQQAWIDSVPFMVQQLRRTPQYKTSAGRRKITKQIRALQTAKRRALTAATKPELNAAFRKLHALMKALQREYRLS